MISGKTIFIAPIDWGIGHATRCAAIIRNLSVSNRVIIGVTPLNDFFFGEQFPELQKIYIPSYNIQYSLWLPARCKVLMQWPRILRVIRDEGKSIAAIVREHKVDVVISDNRFGLRDARARNIFVTHQIRLLDSVIGVVPNKVNHYYINLFDEVWVPDYPDRSQRLSGSLCDSAGVKIPVTYVGPLSVFTKHEPLVHKKYDYLVLLSGVEPQRTRLENILLEKLGKTNLKVFIIRGSRQKLAKDTQLPVIDFAYDRELSQLIGMTATVICRSGYSTLMDMHALQHRDLLLIPTPGQPEQVYLARYWKEKFRARVVEQADVKNFNFEKTLNSG